jgi:hypothetical protein
MGTEFRIFECTLPPPLPPIPSPPPSPFLPLLPSVLRSTFQASNYRIGQWYALQRWQDACGGGRGAYPIKFNGLIFVTGISPSLSPSPSPPSPLPSLLPPPLPLSRFLFFYFVDYYVNNVWTYNADYRAWGGGYWFQNTRFPYWAMLTNVRFYFLFYFILFFNIFLNFFFLHLIVQFTRESEKRLKT